MTDPRDPGFGLKHAFVALVVLVAGWHLVGVTAAAVPPNRYSAAVGMTSGHLAPYFAQNWRLFAPNPVSEDRSLRFQGAYIDASGELAVTEWVDWTDVELDLIDHRIVGNRGGYVSNKLIESLSSVRRGLTVEQIAVAEGVPIDEPLGWDELTDALVGAGVNRPRAQSFVTYERAATNLASDVLATRFPDLDFTAVQYSVELLPVVPYAQRNDDDARRPPGFLRISGWREPSDTSTVERDAIADFDRRHR